RFAAMSVDGWRDQRVWCCSFRSQPIGEGVAKVSLRRGIGSPPSKTRIQAEQPLSISLLQRLQFVEEHLLAQRYSPMNELARLGRKCFRRNDAESMTEMAAH